MNILNNQKKEVWIGLAHVKPRKGNCTLDIALGAFVPVLALAENAEIFERWLLNF